jgi:hypothetical protein
MQSHKDNGLMRKADMKRNITGMIVILKSQVQDTLGMLSIHSSRKGLSEETSSRDVKVYKSLESGVGSCPSSEKSTFKGLEVNVSDDLET